MKETWLAAGFHDRGAGVEQAVGLPDRDSRVGGFDILQFVEQQRRQQAVEGHVAAAGNHRRQQMCSHFDSIHRGSFPVLCSG